VLCRPADETSVVDALSDWLFVASTSADDRWTLLDLESVWQDDSAIARLKDKLDDRGCSVSERSTMSCWRITLPSTWEEYMSRLSKSHRKQVRRIERRTLPRHETQLRRVSNLKELEPAMEILIRLHQKRWLALGEPGCFGRESFEPFLREAAQRFCEMGDLDLVWLEESGRPVAAQIAFLSESTCFVFQSGIDPDFQDYSPGHVIHVLTMQRAIESGRRYFDFLRGDEPYKLHWRADPLSCVNLRIAPPLAVAQIRNGMWLAQDVVRRAVKDGLRWSGLR
jgi:hypothetical protein